MKCNSIGCLSFAALMILLAASGAFAQATVPTFAVNVPFAFSTGNAQMPAGHYQIREDAEQQSITILNMDSGMAALAKVEQDTSRGAQSKLLFHRVGNEYYLAGIRGGRYGMDATLPVSKQERKAQSLQVAGVTPRNSQNIEIALK
jgi:hypothetical protein